MEREELHRRIELLKKRIEEGKFHVAPHLVDNFKKSLSKVRLAADGMVDPDTVDSRIRALLLTIAYQADREEWKEAVSLPEIQRAYFQRVEHAFGQPFEMMSDVNVNPGQFARWFTFDKARVAEAISVIDEFVTGILEFWENISEPTWIHLEDAMDSKAVFSGELFPDGNSNVAGSTGIYFDTTILPDPFVRISPLLGAKSEEERCYEVLRLGLQVLQYKELALVDTSVPIVAILPSKHRFESSYHDFVHGCAERDAVLHASNLFGRRFADIEDLQEFLRRYPEPGSLVSALKKPEELVFATEWKGDLATHIRRHIAEQPEELKISTAGYAVFMQLISRFMQANDTFQRSRHLNGTPIIRAETSWLWFNWMLRNNAKPVDQEEQVHLHIARALNTTVPNEMSWFGNVPPEAIIEIRKAGALDEIRGILGSGVTELIQANPGNFFRTGDQVFDNLQNAFSDHQKKIKELWAKKLKFAGRDISSFLVVGGIALTAAITGSPLYGAVAAGAGMSGVIPTAKELKGKLQRLKAQQSETNNTGIGILFNRISISAMAISSAYAGERKRSVASPMAPMVDDVRASFFIGSYWIPGCWVRKSRSRDS
ncbi:MAG: hypothetical protein KJO08_00705, partial [Gammaproteobacteria bacterium]|nr:hypothetical protein [Gammaproteobacteria bacterium]